MPIVCFARGQHTDAPLTQSLTSSRCVFHISKQLKLTELSTQGRRSIISAHKMVVTPSSEATSESDSLNYLPDEGPFAEKYLHTILQALCITIQVDFKKIIADFDKDITEQGHRTSQFEHKQINFLQQTMKW
ncbi:Hypothetical predicted protein [Pelobates cultripes]|uniref:Uncharacterized protein n=1 Tax=Pelobates cultripes TaxID=61616 RepID=A0AAD1RJK0_PELCU|nr:Hypothetical predicted protein [Pelobates cultripes]